MLNSINRAIGTYMKRPLFFMKSAFLFAFFYLMALLAVVGLFLIFFFAMTVLGMTKDIIPFVVAGAILFLIFLYLTSAFKGALFRAFYLSANGQKMGIRDFCSYALGNGSTFFGVFIISILFVALLNAPIAALYWFYLKDNMFQYGEIILAVIALGLTFIAEFFAVPAMMGAAIYGTGVGRAFSFAGTFAKRTHIMGLVFFAIYSFVWLTSYPGLIYAATLVPSAFLILFLFLFLVHLVAMFITYPIVATAFMLYVEKKVAMKVKN